MKGKCLNCKSLVDETEYDAEKETCIYCPKNKNAIPLCKNCNLKDKIYCHKCGNKQINRLDNFERIEQE